MKHQGKTNPPGRRKIIEALFELMKVKNFHRITTAEIARTAGVTEGLIYKYFEDKTDLLYQVLHLHFAEFNNEVLEKLKSERSSIGKLETVIRASLESYSSNRVFARMLLLEVRSLPSYFESDAYEMVRVYAATILDIINEGVQSGEIRPDIDPYVLRKMLIGGIEHACLGEIIFGRDLDVEKTTEAMTQILLHGVRDHEPS